MARGPFRRTAPGLALLAVLALGATDVLAKGGTIGRVPVVPDTSAGFASEVAKAEEPFIAQLEQLGQWCEASTLFIERAQVAEALLLIDSDNEKGRAWLRFKRQKDRTWKQTSTKPFFDEKKELLPEWEKRHAEIVDPMREALEPFLARAEDWHTAGIRDRVLRTLVALYPDDEGLRDRSGEKLVDGRWILKESADLAARRRRIREFAAEAKKTAKPAAAALPQKTSEYAACLATADFTLNSRLPLADAQAVAATVMGARLLYEKALGVSTQYRKGLIVDVVANVREGERLLDSHPEVSDGHRKSVRGLTSYWLDRTRLVIAKEDPAERLDSTARHTFASAVWSPDVGRLFDAPGWLSEGAGMYLTHALLGTRLTVFVKETRYADDSVSRELADGGYDWVLTVKRLVVEKGVAPNLRVLTGLPLNSMTKDDGLMAYGLAAYFLAGRPEDLRELLARLAKGHEFHEALALSCNIDVEALEGRFVRWLREMK